jgi:hypothetical protein
MIKLTMFVEGNGSKTNKAAKQPVIPIGAYGRNFSQRCEEMRREAEVLYADIVKQSSANPGYQGAAVKLKAAMKKLTEAAKAFEKVQ